MVHLFPVNATWTPRSVAVFTDRRLMLSPGTCRTLLRVMVDPFSISKTTSPDPRACIPDLSASRITMGSGYSS
jgi:hypothetical protein